MRRHLVSISAPKQSGGSVIEDLRPSLTVERLYVNEAWGRGVGAAPEPGARLCPPKAAEEEVIVAVSLQSLSGRPRSQREETGGSHLHAEGSC